MTEEEFREELDRRAPHLSPKSREETARYYARILKRTERCYIPDAVLHAGHIDELLSGAALASTDTRTVAVEPGAFLASNAMASVLLPEVILVRRQVFGREDPPFRAKVDAEAWLAQPGHRPLLARHIKGMVEGTPFSEEAIEAFVLMGTAPHWSAIEVKIQSTAYTPAGGGTITFTKATIETTRPTTYEQRLAACGELGKVLKRVGKHELSEKDQRLSELIRQVGEPPPKGAKGRKAYWEDMRQRWNADARNKPLPPGSRALEMRWQRMQPRLYWLMFAAASPAS
jgi:hypothetical protein